VPEATWDQSRADAESPPFTEWLISLVPNNPVKAAANGDFLQIVIFTLFFALAVTCIQSELAGHLTKLFQGIGEAALVMVHWLLCVAPIGIFAVVFGFALQVGMDVAGVLIRFVTLLSCLLIGFTIILYPIAVLAGRVSLRAFARSLYSAQVVALSTRSSLASLPALLDGAKTWLDMPRDIIGFALPFSASAFKVNRTISGPASLLFLAHLYGIHLHPMQIVTFVITTMILSFSSPGIPQGGDAFKTLPVYVAAGIPLEGVILIKVVDVIPDIFKTLVNVTSYMTVSVLLVRIFGRTIDAECGKGIVLQAPSAGD
jgi:Na+/H+-dicarboxylate symporter